MTDAKDITPYVASTTDSTGTVPPAAATVGINGVWYTLVTARLYERYNLSDDGAGDLARPEHLGVGCDGDGVLLHRMQPGLYDVA